MARIAHAGFIHETNTFAPMKTTWDDFSRPGFFPGLLQGQAVIEKLTGVNIGTGGFVEEVQPLGYELIPIAWAFAETAAHVTEDAFERMSALIIEGLTTNMPYDAVYLCLHGAMITEHLEDAEGELIRRVREVIGMEIPLVASLDLHSNTTEAMLTLTDGLVACRTYPHEDMAATGRRAAHFLHNILVGSKPAKARRALPFLIPLTGQCTMMQPTQGVYKKLEELEQTPGVQLISFTPGFPAADIRDCGPVVVAYGDDQASADGAVDALYNYIVAREKEFQVPFQSPEDAVQKAIDSNAPKPTVLADVQDNSGAGATSDTTGLLRAMVRLQADDCVLGIMVDPEVAQAAHDAGEGAEIQVSLGGKVFTEGDPPFEGKFKIEKLGDGKITCTGPHYGGLKAQLGPMALLRIGGVRVVVSTHRMQAADQALFRHLGIEPAEEKILGLKSTVHFRADFDPIAEEILVVKAPGAFIDQPETLPYKNLRPGVRVCPGGREHTV